MKKFICALVFALLCSMSSYSVAADNPDKFELNSATADQITSSCFFSEDKAYSILDLRDQLGSFQTWDDLNDLGLSEAELSVLKANATISGITADCGC